MTDARWIDIDADFAAAAEHFANGCTLYDVGGFDAPGIDGYRARMALMHAMQSAYTSAEAGMLRLLRLLSEEAPQGEDWHYKLIERLRSGIEGERSRPPVFSDDVAVDLHEARSFRHRVIHGYGDFKAERALPSIEAARRLSTALPVAVNAFKRLIDDG
ncbi:MAG: hypothetical protein ACK4U0_18375 [Mesorhizobium sp.]